MTSWKSPAFLRRDENNVDARECLIEYFETATGSAAPSVAIELLLKAAEPGSFADRKAATDQVAIVLRGRALY